MKSNRRGFIKQAGIASLGISLFPSIVKASVLGRGHGHRRPGQDGQRSGILL